MKLLIGQRSEVKLLSSGEPGEKYQLRGFLENVVCHVNMETYINLLLNITPSVEYTVVITAFKSTHSSAGCISSVFQISVKAVKTIS